MESIVSNKSKAARNPPKSTHSTRRHTGEQHLRLLNFFLGCIFCRQRRAAGRQSRIDRLFYSQRSGAGRQTRIAQGRRFFVYRWVGESQRRRKDDEELQNRRKTHGRCCCFVVVVELTTVQLESTLTCQKIGKGVLDKLRRDESFEASQVELGARLDSSNPNTILTCTLGRYALRSSACITGSAYLVFRRSYLVLGDRCRVFFQISEQTRSFVPGLLHRTARVNTSLDSMQADRVVTRFGEFQKE